MYDIPAIRYKQYDIYTRNDFKVMIEELHNVLKTNRTTNI